MSTSRARAGARLFGRAERSLVASTSTVARRQAAPNPKRVSTRSASSFAPLSSLSNFFSRKSPSVPVSDPRSAFLDALAAGRPDALYEPYHTLRATGTAVSAVDLTSALVLLRYGRTEREAELVETMFNDITDLYGRTPKAQHHRARIRAMSIWQPERALEIIQDLDMTAREWNWVLAGLVSRAPEAFDRGLQAMAEAGVAKDVLTFNIQLDALRRSRDLSTLPAVLYEMESQGVERDLATQSTLLSLYASTGDFANAQQIADMMTGPLDRHAHEALIAFKCAQDGPDAALSYVQELQRDSYRPSRIAMETIIKPSMPPSLTPQEALDLVIRVERIARRDVGSPAWTLLIHHILKDSLQSAYETYCLARGRGVEVDINMVRQLIVDLCNLSPPRLSEAMELYNDLINAEANHANAPESRFIPTISLYKFLLPAAARTTPPAESVAISLLNDMRSRRLKFDATTLTSLTILLMRSSTSHYTAFRAYAHMYALDKQLLDRHAYAAIISAFINLSWPSSRLAPPNLFLEIVKDMRKAGFTPNAQVYTSLLHRYGANVQRRVDRLSSPDIPVPEAEPERWVTETLEAIQAIHTVIKLDPSVTIDVPLLNALMNAYNRVGAFAEAFEVWDELVERRAHEKPELYAASINVALDACGYSEAHVKAHRVWRWARRNNLTVDRNWDAWIECLARLGEMDEAVETVCGEMKRRENGAPGPTADTLRILLRFSWRSKDVYRHVKERVEQEFPEMWTDVKDVVETSRHQ